MLQGSATSVSVALRLNAAPLLASVYQSARVRGCCLFQQKDARLDRWTPFCVVEETSMNRMFYACPAAFDFINIAQVEVRKSPNFYKFVFFLFSLSSSLALPSLIPRKIPAPLGRKKRGGACFLKRRFFRIAYSPALLPYIPFRFFILFHIRFLFIVRRGPTRLLPECKNSGQK